MEPIVYRYQQLDRDVLARWAEMSRYCNSLDQSLSLVRVVRVDQRARSGGAKAWVAFADGVVADAWFEPHQGSAAAPGNWLLIEHHRRWGEHREHEITQVDVVHAVLGPSFADEIALAQEREGARQYFQATGAVLPVLARGHHDGAKTRKLASAGMWLGIASFFVGFFGVTSAVGLTLSIVSARRERSARAIIGIVLNAIMLLLTALGAILFFTIASMLGTR